MKQQTYFINYEKIWETIEDYNHLKKPNKKIKGGSIDTLCCILYLYEELFNRYYYGKEEGEKVILEIDAFRISKLAGYETKTIKDHIEKLQQLNIALIESSIYDSFYKIKVPLQYIFQANKISA